MSTTGHETEAINVRGLKASLKKGGNIGIFNECICSTAGGTAAKVTNTVPPSFSLVSGAKIIVKFTYAITVANATLQVGETAAKPIRIMGSALDANIIKAGTSVLLSYDGTAYNIIGGVGGNDVDVNYDTTNGKLTKTINGTTTDIVVLDTAPTSGSKKPVTSGAVYQAIQEALINPISDSSIVSTTTFNKRDVISLNGTMYMADNATSDLPLKTPVVQGSNIVTQDGMVVIQGGTASSDWHSFG